MSKLYPWIQKDLAECDKLGHTKERAKVFINQYKERGWCDAELWNIDHEFGKWILPRLKAYSTYANGVPGGLKATQWEKIISDMIAGFEIMAHEKLNWSATPEQEAQANKAMHLFGKYGRSLWC